MAKEGIKKSMSDRRRNQNGMLGFNNSLKRITMLVLHSAPLTKLVSLKIWHLELRKGFQSHKNDFKNSPPGTKDVFLGPSEQ